MIKRNLNDTVTEFKDQVLDDDKKHWILEPPSFEMATW